MQKDVSPISINKNGHTPELLGVFIGGALHATLNALFIVSFGRVHITTPGADVNGLPFEEVADRHRVAYGFGKVSAYGVILAPAIVVAALLLSQPDKQDRKIETPPPAAPGAVFNPRYTYA